MRYIYTVITGDKDILNEDINTDGATAVCFTDNPNLKSDVWEIRQIPQTFSDTRRNSRLPKMLPHIYFPGAEYSLYLDGNIISKVPINKIIREWLKETDIAVFAHSTRDCLFDEAQECIRLELDDKLVIQRHTERYTGFPTHNGLYQCGVIIRKHTPKIKQLNEMWFAEYCTGSKRDQISFPYCIDKCGVTIYGIRSHAWVHDWFEMENHHVLSEWANKL